MAPVITSVQGQCFARRRQQSVVTSWVAVENSRIRRQRGSHRRALPVRTSRSTQAGRSSAIWTVASQSWFYAASWRGVAQAGGTGGADASPATQAPSRMPPSGSAAGVRTVKARG